ncbi:prepilin-type N-terminal cleavage/methylation domain-containing protein [Desulfurobacterium pacificum]|uniref:Prepilin-type N-terminal cleavage/methylation domain-containing protein n=1 Tax=Desulfurobacterium pacificum TaxID=240166 RepID=A0ABY1NDN2_9BACT|nr:prepilin-type N-terminal cleavage/methylation domain-containing protein [Desulfurobacterium pacificum]SMP06418.1 prepilin-type N-terminal cleavage/methylation domain-containing protein [Desulfurobacterium pacificum]
MKVKAFSLIELLITITILSILTAIAIPSYMKYRQKAIVSRIQGDLVACAGELMAEYANNGTTTKTCKVYKSSDNCTLVIDKLNDKIKIENSYCDFNINSKVVRCEIHTNYGNVNGYIDCYYKE